MENYPVYKIGDVVIRNSNEPDAGTIGVVTGIRNVDLNGIPTSYHVKTSNIESFWSPEYFHLASKLHRALF